MNFESAPFPGTLPHTDTVEVFHHFFIIMLLLALESMEVNAYRVRNLFIECLRNKIKLINRKNTFSLYILPLNVNSNLV